MVSADKYLYTNRVDNSGVGRLQYAGKPNLEGSKELRKKIDLLKAKYVNIIGPDQKTA
ncbi:hypothetical protein ACFL5G_04710 [Candidatus Margulisiibacteriota bacterium]